ncbi:MAG: cyclic nucleotide-binding protein [Nocardioides sp.]|nr:cyclic nucleotide-binding protein [Nocardioides sp.]
MATFFDSFTPREVAQISAHGRKVKLPEGWSPIWERTPADKAYVILDGTVSVRKGGEEVAVLGAGDIVGEAAIVGHKLRSASVVAMTPITAIHFTDTDINELIADLPGFQEKLVAVVESRISG